jgi:tetratricopeptide (TPR) repeat protein
MSPEQVDMAGGDIDTRSDIYSLGALLYVLLTGILPFDSGTLRGGGVEHVRKTIRETDPKTPSIRLRKLGDEAQTVAENRSTHVAALAKRLRSELEWIPLKAMRKDRAERYRSASELADDIENYLKGAPLIAGPPGTLYRFKKFARRHAVLFAAVLSVALTLLLGLTATTVMYLRAERQARISEAVSDFLRNDLIASVTPANAKGREVTIHSFLDRAGENLETRFQDEPLVEASVRETLGNTYRHLGDFAAAERHLERACQLHQEQLGLEDARTLSSISGLIWVYFSQGRYVETQHLAGKAFKASRRMYGEGHRALVGPTNEVAFAHMKMGQYREAESLYLGLLETYRRLYGEGYGPAFGVQLNLARVYSKQGRYQEAEQLFDKVLPARRREQGEEHPFVLVSTTILARVYAGQGRYADAEDLCRKVWEIERRVVGEEHLYTLECMSEFACVHIAQKCYPEAEDLLNRALEIARRRLRQGHPLTLRFVNGLAVVHTKLRHYEEAEPLFDEALRTRQRELGDDHPETLETINDLGVLRRAQQRYQDAESLLCQALDGRRQKLGPDHPACSESMHELALVYVATGDYDKAEPLLLEAFRGREAKLGPEHPDTIESLKQLVTLYESWPKPDEAAKWQVTLSQQNDAGR